MKLTLKQFIMDSNISDIILSILFILTVGFILYVYFTTRTKERLLQIEKGVDSSIFKKNQKSSSIIWGILLFSIGIGVFVGSLLVELGIREEVSYNGSIFMFSGIGLIVGFLVKRKISQ